MHPRGFRGYKALADVALYCNPLPGRRLTKATTPWQLQNETVVRRQRAD